MAIRTGTAVAIVGLFMTAPTAWSATPIYLGADELRTLIVGNTVEIENPSGIVVRAYFDADGQSYLLQPDGSESASPWHIEPDGTHCVTRGADDDCARVARNEDGTWSSTHWGVAVHQWLRILSGKVLAQPQLPPNAGNRTKPGYISRPDPADYYPIASRNLGEQGLVKVRVCYNKKGETQVVMVAEASRFARLDEAAVKYGKAIRVRPGTLDGIPVADCVVVPVQYSFKGYIKP